MYVYEINMAALTLFFASFFSSQFVFVCVPFAQDVQ